jgi:hypothetical protein
LPEEEGGDSLERDPKAHSRELEVSCVFISAELWGGGEEGGSLVKTHGADDTLYTCTEISHCTPQICTLLP